MIAVLLALAASCQATAEAAPAIPPAASTAPAPCTQPAASDWRAIATDADRDRLRRARAAWTAGLVEARGKDGGVIAADATLFDPDRALAGATPPPGPYRCRTFKLGAKGPYSLPFVAYPISACRIDADGDRARLITRDGAQRPTGTLYPDGDARAVFLGTLVLGDERIPLRYGQDRTRDMAGFVERIGERRWRLVLPSPAFESLVDVVELVPGD